MDSPAANLIVATSSSALFDLRESDRVYREEGLAAYADYQIANEGEPLAPGDAVLLLLQPTRVAASATVAIVKNVRIE